MEGFEQQQGSPPQMAVFGGLRFDPSAAGIEGEEIPFDEANTVKFAWGTIEEHPVGLEWHEGGEDTTLFADSADGAEAAVALFGAELGWTPETWQQASKEGSENPYRGAGEPYGEG